MLRLHLTQFQNSLFLWQDQHHENLALFGRELELLMFSDKLRATKTELDTNFNLLN